MQKKHIALAALLATAFVAVALTQARFVNTDVGTHDQSQYLLYAIEQASTGYEALGNRMQMPVYPTLQSLLLSGATPELAFARAKLVAIVIGALSTLGVWAVLLSELDRLGALAIGVVYTLYVAAFRSAYVQCEPLYYALAFGGFVAMVRAWEEPRAPNGLRAGAITAVAWLTKGSMLFGAEIFLVALALRALTRRRASDVLTAAAFALGFGAIVSPYAENSKRCCGEYLYNMSTRYVVWCDSWEQFLAKAGELGPAIGWHALPDDRVPSMRSYLRTHDALTIAARELRGLALVVGNTLVGGTGYQLFVYGWIAIAIAIVARDARLRARLRASELAPLVVPYFTLQALALGFYGDIAAGTRFSLALFLPGCYCLHRALARDARWSIVVARSTAIALALSIALLPLARFFYAGG